MISSLSIAISPISLTITATLSACRFARIWFSSVVLPLPRKPAMTVAGKRDSRAAMGGIVGREGIGGAHCRLAYTIAECIGQRVQGAPAGAVTGDEVFDAERPQPFDGVGND